MTFHIGIDPGVSGALAVYSTDPNSTPTFVEAIDLPVITLELGNGKKRNRIDIPALHAILARFENIASITIEDVHSMPGEGEVNAFSFGHCLGVIGALARIASPNVSYVTPQVWKRAYGLTADKRESRHIAQSLTGDRERFRRVKDADRAEAALLALYGACNGNVLHQGTALAYFRATLPPKTPKTKKKP